MTTTFSSEDLAEMVWGNLPEGWTVCEPTSIEDQGRWWTSFSMVITNNIEYYRISWQRGSTEMQDEGAENIEASRVYPHQVMTTIYKDTP